MGILSIPLKLPKDKIKMIQKKRESNEKEEEFVEYLMAKRLGKVTIQSYLLLHRHFSKAINSYGLKQSIINRFILNHPSNKTRAFLKNYFDFKGITELNIPRPTGRKPRKKYPSISPQEMKVLREFLYADQTKYGLMLDLSYSCALRRAEVLGITPENFNWMKWKEDQTQPCRLKISGKGGKDRYVVVPPEITKEIVRFINNSEYLEEQKSLFGVAPATWDLHFKRIVREVLKKNYTLHDLRRSRALNWHSKGQDLIQIKTRLGHASISTTQLYINPDEEKSLKEWEEEY